MSKKSIGAKPPNGNFPSHIYHDPQFIVIEEDKPQDSDFQKSESAEGISASITFPTIEHPWRMRLLALVSVFLMIILFSLSVIMAVLTAVSVAVTLGLSSFTFKALQFALALCRKTAVLTLGLFIAIFSPTFGIATILVYFLIVGEEIGQEFIRVVMRPDP